MTDFNCVLCAVVYLFIMMRKFINHHSTVLGNDMPADNEDQLILFEKNSSPLPETVENDSPSEFSKYIVYVDESGDHVLHTNDPNYPIFVLAFCVFHKKHYSEDIVPALEKFKFQHFGHDQVVLHERDIRKETGYFNKFRSHQEKNSFLNELTEIIDTYNFILISCLIDKKLLTNNSDASQNLYHLALASCMESLYEFLKEKEQETLKTHVVVECRGTKEDKELELEFRRICDGNNRLGHSLPFDVLFADKKVMSSGLQMADLVARPIGVNYLRPMQNNRAFEVLKRKFYCDGGRSNVGKDYEGVGLQIIPGPKKRKAPMKPPKL